MFKWTARALAAAAGLYGAFFSLTWLRYGRAGVPAQWPADPLLDRFMPTYDVAERHRVFVAAPAELTLRAACEQDLNSSRVVRAIFKTRQLVLRGEEDRTVRPRGLVAMTESLGWGVLAEKPGREIVMGAITRPWEANAVFRRLPPDDFASFAEPGYVKIVWTLRVHPAGRTHSVFSTETRATTTDAVARAKFRWYWSAFSPGIWTIRRLSLGPLRRDAERRAAALGSARC
jgi:hypothetical protein